MDASGTPDDGPRRMIDAFVRGWNTHDMSKLGALFTSDASWTTTYDARSTGRAAIVADFTAAHEEFAGATTIVPGVISVRMVRPDVAVIELNMDLVWSAEGQVGRSLLILAVDEGGWHISAGQITKPNCREGD